MGNNCSSNDTTDGNRHGSRESGGTNNNALIPNIGLLRRGLTGNLGLTRAELDKICKPSGLYPTCTWDDRTIRRLIGDGKLAARSVGHETILSSNDKECPICFLYYSQVNETLCCKANICTECYLQVRPMHEKNCVCSFCNTSQFNVKISKKEENKPEEKNLADIDLEKTAEKVVKKEIKDGEFGSRLLRVRSESITSSEISFGDDTHTSCTMSPEERKRIEEEMKEQYDHPLARRIDTEAEERRQEHDQTYRRASSERLGRNRNLLNRSLLSGRGRSWNQIMRAFENTNGENGRVQTLDDLVVLEAAILLSMEQQAARRRNRDENEGETSDEMRTSFPQVLHALMARRAAEEARREADDNDEEGDNVPSRRIHRLRQGRRERMSGMISETGATAALLMRGVSEEEQMEMAIAASLRESQTENNTEENNAENNTDPGDENEQSEAQLNPNNA